MTTCLPSLSFLKTQNFPFQWNVWWVMTHSLDSLPYLCDLPAEHLCKLLCHTLLMFHIFLMCHTLFACSVCCPHGCSHSLEIFKCQFPDNGSWQCPFLSWWAPEGCRVLRGPWAADQVSLSLGSSHTAHSSGPHKTDLGHHWYLCCCLFN